MLNSNFSSYASIRSGVLALFDTKPTICHPGNPLSNREIWYPSIWHSLFLCSQNNSKWPWPSPWWGRVDNICVRTSHAYSTFISEEPIEKRERGNMRESHLTLNHAAPWARLYTSAVYSEITIGSYNGSAVFMTRWTIPVTFKFFCVVVVFRDQWGVATATAIHEPYGTNRERNHHCAGIFLNFDIAVNALALVPNCDFFVPTNGSECEGGGKRMYRFEWVFVWEAQWIFYVHIYTTVDAGPMCHITVPLSSSWGARNVVRPWHHFYRRLLLFERQRSEHKSAIQFVFANGD